MFDSLARKPGANSKSYDYQVFEQIVCQFVTRFFPFPLAMLLNGKDVDHDLVMDDFEPPKRTVVGKRTGRRGIKNVYCRKISSKTKRVYMQIHKQILAEV